MDALKDALEQLYEIALRARQGIINNPPHYFLRTFAEKIQQCFEALTGAGTGGQKFRDFVSAAWHSALPNSQHEPSWERILRNRKMLDNNC